MTTPTIDYNQIANTYASTRTAMPWVVELLAAQIRPLSAGAVVLEIGCGTGNHIRALAEQMPQFQYEGFDQSYEMLREAQQQPSKVVFRQGDAQEYWPYMDDGVHIAFGVDMIHYIHKHTSFFQEAYRVLKPGGTLYLVTDSEADLQNRSLTRYFPEVLEHELARYPMAETLHNAAMAANLTPIETLSCSGDLPITDAYIANLASKCSSALRLIAPTAHAEGLERVRQAQARGERWQSLYTIYVYGR